jgi:hypothetical protein
LFDVLPEEERKRIMHQVTSKEISATDAYEEVSLAISRMNVAEVLPIAVYGACLSFFAWGVQTLEIPAFTFVAHVSIRVFRKHAEHCWRVQCLQFSRFCGLM